MIMTVSMTVREMFFDKIYNDIEIVYEIYGQKEDPNEHLVNQNKN